MKTRDAFSKFERVRSDRGHDSSIMPAALEVESFWGVRNPLTVAQPIPPAMRLLAPGPKYAEGAEVNEAYLMHRKPAKDENGKSLAFVLDEVDRQVIDARRHFQPPVAGDKDSPRTIYDYIEAKVRADPNVMRGWA